MGLYSYKAELALENNNCYNDTNFNNFCMQSVTLFAESAYNDVVIDYYISEACEVSLINEGFMDTIKNIFDAIVTAIKKFVGKVRDLFKNIFGIFSKNKNDIKETEKKEESVKKQVKEQIKEKKEESVKKQVKEKEKTIDEIADKINKTSFKFKDYNAIALYLCEQEGNYDLCATAVELMESVVKNSDVNMVDFNEKSAKQLVEKVALKVNYMKRPKYNSNGTKQFVDEINKAQNDSVDDNYYNKILSIINNAHQHYDDKEIELSKFLENKYKINMIDNSKIDNLKKQFDAINKSEAILIKRLKQLENEIEKKIDEYNIYDAKNAYKTVTHYDHDGNGYTYRFLHKDDELDEIEKKDKNDFRNGLMGLINEVHRIIMFDERRNFTILQNATKLVNMQSSSYASLINQVKTSLNGMGFNIK